MPNAQELRAGRKLRPRATAAPAAGLQRALKLPRAHQSRLAIQNEELREVVQKSEALLNAIPDLIFTTNRAGQFLDVKASDQSLLFAPSEVFLHRTVHDVLPQPTADLVMGASVKALDSKTVQSLNYSLAVQGQEKYFEARIAPSTRDNAISIVRDITERKQIEEELKASEERYRLLFDRATDGILILSEDGTLLAVNKAFASMHGYTEAEMAGLHLRNLDTPETLQGLPARLERILAGEVLTFNVTHYHKDGRVLVLEVSSSLITADGRRLIQAFHRDITERWRTEELVREMAYYDPLTRLANRMLLRDRLTQSMLAGQRSGNYGALIFLDLDNFKPLNDEHGHGVGDLLLVEVAKRLKDGVRQIDTVARFGGDEFVVLLDDLASDKEQARIKVDLVADKIRSTLANPYVLQTPSDAFGLKKVIEHRCTVSIGVSLFLGHENTSDEILKWADLAMYKAKDAGRNTACFFDPEMQIELANRLVLEYDLREAIQKQQFCVHYQPQINTLGEITGVEALLRWQHPKRGWVQPATFIRKAEKIGQIVPLGLWVLETAGTQLARWATQASTAHLTMAINVSARQFHQSDFVDQVLEVLARTGANPGRLKFELTESVLFSNLEGVITQMNVLKDVGVSFSLDDFGTGYSSLACLKRLPLAQLKIAQEFVRDILVDPDVLAIARMVLALADSMGLHVIAEGVETEAQRVLLAALGCHHYQGHLFSQALPVPEFEALLARVPN